jgi:hypothetical protein
MINRERWDAFRKSYLKIGTLHYLAKQNDRNRYHELLNLYEPEDPFLDDYTPDNTVKVSSRYLLNQNRWIE